MPSMQQVHNSTSCSQSSRITELLAEGQPPPSGTSEGRGAGSLASLAAGQWSPGPGLPKTTALSLCPSLKGGGAEESDIFTASWKFLQLYQNPQAVLQALL